MQESREELKRADHLLYVSLKYTRTVDVIKSIILRLISGIGLTIDVLLQHAKAKKKIKEIPPQIGVKCEIVKKIYNDPKLNEMIEFFLLLRRISNAEYKKSNEYRRHVTMTVTVDNTVMEVTMDLIKEYYQKTNEYIDHVESIIYPKKD